MKKIYCAISLCVYLCSCAVTHVQSETAQEREPTPAPSCPTSLERIRGTATLPATALGKTLYVRLSTEATLTRESIELGFRVGAGTAQAYDFILFRVCPGNYYLYAFVDQAGNGFPADSTDFEGWYGAGGTRPVVPNMQVVSGGLNIFDITLIVKP